MTIDQSNSEFRMSPACNLGVAAAAEASDYVAQGASIWDLRGHRRNVPALPLRLPHARRRQSDLPLPSASTTRRANTRANQGESRTQQLLMSAHEDIARLNEILRSQQCTVVMRGTDGAILPLHSTTESTQGGRSNGGTERLDPPADASILFIPNIR